MNYEQSLLHDVLNIKTVSDTVLIFNALSVKLSEFMRSTRPMKSRIKARETSAACKLKCY